MTEKMWCPLTQGWGKDGERKRIPCDGVLCAWWNGLVKCCAIALIAKNSYKGAK